MQFWPSTRQKQRESKKVLDAKAQGYSNLVSSASGDPNG